MAKHEDSPDEIERFFKIVFDLQAQDPDVPLSENRLKRAALDAGVSEEDWQRVVEEARNCHEKGRTFLTHSNYIDAIPELERAADFAPYDIDVLTDLARAHELKWNAEKSKTSKERALLLYQKCLQSDSSHPRAAEGISRIRQPKSEPPLRSKKTVFAAAVAALLLLSGGIQIYRSMALPSNQKAATEEIGESFEFEGRRFVVVSAPKINWESARNLAENMGGHLAFVKDKETHEFVQRIAANRRLWLGASDVEEEGKWKWLDGTSIDFSDWGGPNPDNHSGADNYLCINPKGKWNDAPMHGKVDARGMQGFICEIDSPNNAP